MGRGMKLREARTLDGGRVKRGDERVGGQREKNE